MESAGVESVRFLFTVVSIVLVVGMFGSRLARLVKIPDVTIFLLLGIVVGPVLHWVSLSPQSVANQFLVTIGASLILFDGGRAIQLRVLKKVWLTLMLLAVPGVLITAIVTGVVAMWFLHLPFLFALLLAAIVASTDPATLIPVFKQIRITEKLKETLESESACNDATGSIVVFALLGVVAYHETFSLTGSLLAFLKMACGGLVIGFLMGWVAAMLISVRKSGIFHEYATIVALAVAICSYLLGDLLGVSGFMATFTAGLVLGNHHAFGWPVDDGRLVEVNQFFDGITFIFRMMIFILLGAQVDFAALAEFWWQGLLIVLVLIFVARPLTVFLCAGLDPVAKWTRNELLFMCWVRETGVIPAALVAMISGLHLPYYRQIHAVTFMAILLTILVQAGSTGIVAEALGVARSDKPLARFFLRKKRAPKQR